LLLAGRPVVATACPFCSAVSLTFAQEIAQSQVAVIARLVEPPTSASLSPRADGPLPKGRFVVVETLKGGDLLEGAELLDVDGVRQIETIMLEVKPAGSTYLLMAIVCLLTTASMQAQTAISPTTWTGHGASTSGASAFTTLPASTTPGSSAVVISQWDRGATSYTSAGSSYNSNNWTSGSSLSAAQSANSYVYFTVTTNASTEVEVTNVTVETQVSSTGPGNSAMTYSIDGGTEVTFGSAVSPSSRGSGITYTFSGTMHLCANQTATFKLYGWNATGSTGTLRINNNTSITATYITAVSDSAAASPTAFCAGGTLNLYGSYRGGVSAYSYAWSGPASFTSTVANPVITSASAAAAGTYSLVVTDGYSCRDTATATVTVSAPPTITATPAAPSICFGATGVRLTASGAGAGGTYSWTPSAGLTSTTTDTTTALPAATATYTVTGTTAAGCSNTYSVTVSRVSGVSITSSTRAVCSGDSATLTSTPTGTWATAAASVVSVHPATGVIYGVSPGTALLTVTTSGGCTDTITITCNPGVVLTAMPDSVCEGATTSWSATPAGGVWTSFTTAVASVDVSTGTIYGVNAGVSFIRYSTFAGCSAISGITVNALPTISGASTLCTTASTSLSPSIPGGTWSSSTPAVASVDGTGNVVGVSAGSANITYNAPTGCQVVFPMVIVGTPSPISGTGPLCVGSTFMASATPVGGAWSISNAGVATVNASGMVTGRAAGTAIVTYTIGGSCYSIASFTVNPLPTVTGTPQVCAGSSVSLSATGGAGTWSTSDASVASVDGTGTVTGVAAGSVFISYTLSATGCSGVYSFTVNPLPAAIAGPSTLCVGSITVYTDASAGGSWTTANAAVASVQTTGPTSATGYGVAIGSTTFTYTLPTGCAITQNVNVSTVPAITGAGNVCQG
ncbi:MAG: hypothetical protein EBZ77_09410, partial [Chitinophagia bacterium]|nr:hypothetical protein [Chitinophagia bacterium]